MQSLQKQSVSIGLEADDCLFQKVLNEILARDLEWQNQRHGLIARTYAQFIASPNERRFTPAHAWLNKLTPSAISVDELHPLSTDQKNDLCEAVKDSFQRTSGRPTDLRNDNYCCGLLLKIHEKPDSIEASQWTVLQALAQDPTEHWMRAFLDSRDAQRLEIPIENLGPGFQRR